MYHSDLREEIRFLKARVLYKTKKLDEARAANLAPEILAGLQQQIGELVEKLEVCRVEASAQNNGDFPGDGI